ncbi:metallophosphoesterase family protein [Dysgonomonas termitidis]|uniref:Calcineurin-like phosphoesterase domain-containing protein n=1 Tax=Dysgonomonas termitidis TaxID=1516126 RepID=A0ABV9L1F2_9BACT
MPPLWSFIPVSAEDIVKNTYPDFKFIRHNGELLTVDIYNKLHSQYIEFLMKELQERKGKRVIVSHHAPALQCMADEFKGNRMNCAYYSDLEKLIKLYNPDYWIYRHSHRNTGSIQVGNTTLLCNQLGYIGKSEQLRFNRASCFII